MAVATHRKLGAGWLLGNLFLAACDPEEKAEPVDGGGLEDAAGLTDAASADAAGPNVSYGDGCGSGDPFDGCHDNESVDAFRWLVPVAADVVFAFADADTLCVCAGNALSLRKVTGQVLWEHALPGKACRALFCDASTGDILLGGDVYNESTFVQRFTFDGEPGKVLVELPPSRFANLVEIVRADANTYFASLTETESVYPVAGLHKFSAAGEALWAEPLITPFVRSVRYTPLHVRPSAGGGAVFTVGSDRGLVFHYEVSSEGEITSTNEEDLLLGSGTSFPPPGRAVDGRYVLAARRHSNYRFAVYAKDGTLKWSHHEPVGDPTTALTGTVLLDDDSVVANFASLRDSTTLMQRVTEHARGESIVWDLKFRNLRQDRGWAIAQQRREIATEDIILGIELDDLGALVPRP